MGTPPTTAFFGNGPLITFGPGSPNDFVVGEKVCVTNLSDRTQVIETTVVSIGSYGGYLGVFLNAGAFPTPITSDGYILCKGICEGGGGVTGATMTIVYDVTLMPTSPTGYVLRKYTQVVTVSALGATAASDIITLNLCPT